MLTTANMSTTVIMTIIMHHVSEDLTESIDVVLTTSTHSMDIMFTEVLLPTMLLTIILTSITLIHMDSIEE